MEKHVSCIAVFSDARRAIAAQEALVRAGIQVAVMPTPRELTAHCGLSLRFAPPLLPQVRQVLADREKGLAEGSFYRLEYDDRQRSVMPVR